MKPGYKQTEVGVIPEGWEVKRLGEMSNLYQPQTISAKEFTETGFPVYGANGVVGRYHKANHSTWQVTVTCRGSTCGTVNRTVEHCWITGNAMVLNCDHNRELDKEFFYHLLSTQNLSDCITGTGQPQIVRSPLAAVRVALPKVLPEQRAIATALSDVDGLLGGLDRLIAKKRDLKQAAMQQLLTGQTRLPGFHGEWEVKRLGEICEIAMGRTPPRLNQAYWGHGYKWLSIADLQTKVVSDSKEEITELAASMMTIIPKGTLLMSFKLSLGRMCFAGCDLFTNEAICSFNRLQANAEFLYYVLGRTDFSLYGKQAVKGYTLNKESLKSIKVTLPALLEQTAIAEVLTEMDGELAVLEQRREKTRALKQAMMQELLTGRIRLVGKN